MVAAHFIHTHTGHPKEEAVGFPMLPHRCCQWAGELPCPGRGALCGCAAALGGAVAPRQQLVTFLVILCRKGVLGGLWFFPLDHLSAAVFNELEKK